MGSPSSLELVVNGSAVSVHGVSSNTTLLQWLRSSGRTGTKEGCAEGDCGACTVAVVDVDAHGERTFRAINSCITLLPMVAGREIVTVEGVGSPEALHPVQRAMVERYGSQCGYCTPGFVVSMFEAYYRRDLADAAGDARGRIGDQLNGNLCRCDLLRAPFSLCRPNGIPTACCGIDGTAHFLPTTARHAACYLEIDRGASRGTPRAGV